MTDTFNSQQPLVGALLMTNTFGSQQIQSTADDEHVRFPATTGRNDDGHMWSPANLERWRILSIPSKIVIFNRGESIDPNGAHSFQNRMEPIDLTEIF
jgi:hypothetical protein